MASAPQMASVEEKEIYGFATKRVLPNCSSNHHVLCSKKLKLDEPPSSSPLEAEYKSDDESDQWGGSLSSAIDERLSTLQLLLPQGPKMEGDEVLRVLIEYVKELESEIKMFNSSSTDGDQSIDDSPLQRRGLCIVPLSTLAKAL
ncbi:hypothetical protein GOP47_0014588 [Adiantum capillus-veneris]|uniref:BHLH domain-containing protein n=1 Tax=Adiantum capillus-veneris TaxID=13818 RepID=A0A9D4ULR7_ADICA|nr:hypothetical protein GOP47_0014588 [Adiantum capillus-veneris]